jgi:hypothetical protein
VRQRELAAIDAAPQTGRDEIRRTDSAKGFTGELLDHIVETLTSRRDRRSGVKMVVIGLGAAAIGFGIGALFQSTP